MLAVVLLAYQLDEWSGVPIWRQSGGDCLIQVTAKASSTVLVLQCILGYQSTPLVWTCLEVVRISE